MGKAAPGASLKAMAEDSADESVKKSLPTFNVDPRKVVIRDGFNGRPINREHLNVMKAVWIAAHDSDQPRNPFPPILLKVENGEMLLVAGFHRTTLYLELIAEGYDIERVPATEVKGGEKEQILAMLGENSGLGWEPMQLGVKYAQLVNACGMSFAEVAAVRGMSVQHVKDCIRLTEQSAEIKEAIQTDAIAPATALKLVKKVGAQQAATMIRDAGILAPKGKKITQKDIDNLGRSVVDAAAKRGADASEHLAAMLESPSVPKLTKAAVRTVVKYLGGDVKDEKPPETPDDYLRGLVSHNNDMVRQSADVLMRHRSGAFIAANASPEAKSYGHMMWLQGLAQDHTRPVLRQGAAWFVALLDANRSGREVAPLPAVMTLDEAIQAEIDSGGVVRAEEMAPEHAALIKHLRGTK